MAAPAGRGRRGPRRALTEDEILDAALSLLDSGGANAATVRGIAAKVGVAPNAVYTYFPDKAAVVMALVERLLGQVDHGVFADRSQPWRQRVEALALELRQQLTAHPGAVSLMIGERMDGPHALALNERLLELLADAGLNPTDAARGRPATTRSVPPAGHRSRPPSRRSRARRW
jgi:TetR/AcrR family tetracycline transcriptional repressor